MATSKPTQICYVCGGKLHTGHYANECSRCGLLYGNLPANPVCRRSLVDRTFSLMHKLGRLCDNVLDLIDIVAPPEEETDVRQTRSRTRRRKS